MSEIFLHKTSINGLLYLVVMESQELCRKEIGNILYARSEDMKRLNRLGNYLNENYGGNYAGNVYDRKFACQNILTMSGGGAAADGGKRI